MSALAVLVIVCGQIVNFALAFTGGGLLDENLVLGMVLIMAGFAIGFASFMTAVNAL